MYNILFYTKDIVQIFIKNNIQVLSDTLHDLFNIYSMFINNEQFVLVSIFPFGTSQNILPKKDKNQIITYNKINNFGPYLAGLIEGDGSSYIPDNIRNNKGKLNQASIEIVFTKYDLSLANEIKHQIGGGYLI